MRLAEVPQKESVGSSEFPQAAAQSGERSEPKRAIECLVPTAVAAKNVIF